MKRILPILLCILLLTGCASLAPDSYTSVTPHQMNDLQETQSDVTMATDYHSLKVAILNQVRTGRPEGTIRASNYQGDIETDLKQAAYEVSTLNPIGAYAVEYMTHSCNLLVHYYEIHVSITFRRSATDIANIRAISSTEQLQEHLIQALNTFRDRLAVQLGDYEGQAEDIASFVTEYCIANPASVVEIPKLTVSVYPEEGKTRILEVQFQYSNSPQVLQAKQRAAENSISAAAEYIRYRQDEQSKLQLLYSYLTQRFHYREAETVTPLYDALCSGIADPAGLSQAWKLICDRAGVECYIVTGLKNSQPYTWNIVKTGNYYRHLDLASCIRNDSGLILRSDVEMSAYHWNTELMPTCHSLPAVAPESPAEEAPEAEEGTAEEETAEESTEESTEEVPESNGDEPTEEPSGKTEATA